MGGSESFSAIQSFLSRFDRFAVFTHLTPDGDALGSAYSMCELIRQMGKSATVILLEAPPDNYAFEAFDPLYKKLDDIDMRDFEACIAVDCAALKRLSKGAEAFESLPNMSVDHHASNDNFAQVNCVRDAPACAQIMYEVYEAMDITPSYTACMAIYMGIIADTGNLTYSSTTPETFSICARLAEEGLDTSLVADRVSNRRSLAATKLIGIFIRHLTLHADAKIAISYIMHSDMVNSSAVAADCEALVNFARDIDTVEVAVFFRELARDKFKVSLRSKRHVNVSEFAEQFGGGGHARAAGCIVEGKRNDLIERFAKELEERV